MISGWKKQAELALLETSSLLIAGCGDAGWGAYPGGKLARCGIGVSESLAGTGESYVVEDVPPKTLAAVEINPAGHIFRTRISDIELRERTGNIPSLRPTPPPSDLNGSLAWMRALALDRDQASWPLRIIAAPRSPIIIVVAWVLPLIKRGMTEASITRSRSKPCTRRWLSTTAISPSPIAHEPTG